MALSPHEYFQATIGRKIDLDGVPRTQPYQCVDLFKDFCKYQLGRTLGACCPSTGYARDIWYDFDRIGINDLFDKVPSNQMVDGDWAIMDFSKAYPDSHVAMFRKDNGNGTGVFLGQNQTASIAVSQINATYNGVIGALRPKVYHQAVSAPAAPSKSISDIAKEVIAGKWGNGNDRKSKLQAAGYDYNTVQAEVNRQLNGGSSNSNQGQGRNYINLSPKANSWAVYDINAAPVKKNAKTYLNPMKFGGLSYYIHEYKDNGTTAVIQTQNYGLVKIYIKHELASVTIDSYKYGLAGN